MDSNFEIRPQVISIVDLLNTQNFLQEFHDINEEIGKTKKSINTALVQIDNIEPNIKVDTNWIGWPKPKDIEKSVSSVFNVIRPHIQECGKAIRSTNKNLQRTLSLIKLIAAAESTIYQQFDEQITSQNELKEIISDWCKQNGIRDEQVNELLESSFQRAYTLRDRINQVKLQVSIANKELSETSKIAKSTEIQVSQLDKQIKGVQEKVQLFDLFITETKVADSKRDERLGVIDQYITETKEADSKRDERLGIIDQYVTETKKADSKRDERLGIIDQYITETKEADSKRDERLGIIDQYITETKEADSKRDERLGIIDQYVIETKKADSKRDERLGVIDQYITETKEADSKRDERLGIIDQYITETRAEYQALRSSYLKIKRSNTILWFVIIGLIAFVLLYFVISITNQTITTI